MPPVIPRCAKHPDAGVISARKIGTDQRVWTCLICGAVLGNAPGTGATGFETDAIGIHPDDIETLDDCETLELAEIEPIE